MPTGRRCSKVGLRIFNRWRFGLSAAHVGQKHCLLWAALLVLATSTISAQIITVVVLDARSGLPISGRNVRISIPDPRTQTPTPHPSFMNFDAKTGSNGKAQVDLLGHLPPRIYVSESGGFSTQCSPHVYKLQDVLSIGILAKNGCNKKVSAKIQAQPGEVIIFSKPESFMDRLRDFPG